MAKLTKSAQPQATHSIHGNITLADGYPFAQANVRAYDRDLRHEELLGTAQTDEKGQYEIRYNSDQYTRREKGAADVEVRVFGPDDALLIASGIHFNAAERLEVNLSIPADKWAVFSAFEKLDSAVRPLLRDVAAADLEENEAHRDISFLAAESGLDRAELTAYVLAQKLAAMSALSPAFWFAFADGIAKRLNAAPTETYTSLADMANALIVNVSGNSVHALRSALEQAQEQKLIPAQLDIVGSIETYRLFLADYALRHPNTALDRAALLAENSALSAKKQARLLYHLSETQELDETAARSLRDDPDFSEEEIQALQFDFEVNRLLDDDIPLLASLKPVLKKQGITSLRALAKWSREDWEKHLKKAKRPDAPQQRSLGASPETDNTERAEQLRHRFETLYPTDSFASALKRDKQKWLDNKEALLALLENNPDFDLQNGSVNDLLATNSRSADSGTKTPDKEKAAEQLKQLQRVFKLTPTYESTKALIEAGIHSSAQIYQMGEGQFVQQFSGKKGFDAAQAKLTYERASNVYAAVLMLVGEANSLRTGTQVAALRAAPAATTSRGVNGLADVPNWDVLFQTGDTCECEDCRSVNSPAAYLADVMQFLHDRKILNNLLARRPDLGYTELSCDNSHTPLPYIDLVNEILEDAVAAPELFKLRSGALPVTTDLQGIVVAENTRKEFKDNTGRALSANAKVNATTRSYWVLRDGAYTYRIQNPTGEVYPWRQTRGGKEQLRAQPEYTNAKAYEILSTAKSSYQLPFSAAFEEVRAYVEKFEMKHWQLMRAFQRQSAPGTVQPAEANVAAAYFGIAGAPSKELEFIVLAETKSQHEFWGFLNATDLVRPDTGVRNLEVFLQKTGLEYNQAWELLALPFVNPGTALKIVHLNNTCDVDKKEITGLTVEHLDRINRFLRLWRKTGWKMWELDLAIRNPVIGKGNLDTVCIENLFYLSEFKNRLGLDVEEACAFFDNMNTSAAFTELYKPLTPSMYERLFADARRLSSIPSEFRNPAAFPPSAVMDGHVLFLETSLQTEEKLISALLGAPALFPDKKLTLPNLSKLYRLSVLVKHVDATADEAVFFARLFEGAPMQSPKSVLERLNDLSELFTAGFSIREIALLTDAGWNSALSSDALAWVMPFLTSLRDEAGETDDATPEGEWSALITNRFAEFTNLPAGMAHALLTQKPLPLTRLLQAAATTKNPLTAAEYPDLFMRFDELYCSCTLLRVLQVTEAKFEWLWQSQPSKQGFGMIELGQIRPMPNIAPCSFEVLLRTVRWFAFNNRHSRQTDAFFTLIESLNTGTERPKFFASAQPAIGWDAKLLEVCCNPGGFPIGFPHGFRDISNWLQLEKALSAMAKLGLPADNFRQAPFTGAAAVPFLKDALRRRVGDTQWQTLNENVQDRLRLRKRDSLVAYLTTRSVSPIGNNVSPVFENANDLYAYYLIDVEMGPCQLTSRLVQANAAVQLFTQRCLLGLEGLTIDEQTDPAWKQWQWMKNYRVWEANRKVFLYPENWIEPELRKEKSEFFKELEDELMQNELNKTNIENAVLNYLEKLNSVANLEVKGSWYEDKQYTLHVVARNFGEEPHTYWYRKMIEDRRWTPWEKLSLDIKGEYVYPFVYKRSLNLLTLDMREEPAPMEGQRMALPVAGGTFTFPEPEKILVMTPNLNKLEGKVWKVRSLLKKEFKSDSFSKEFDPLTSTPPTPKGVINKKGIQIIANLTAWDTTDAIGIELALPIYTDTRIIQRFSFWLINNKATNLDTLISNWSNSVSPFKEMFQINGLLIPNKEFNALSNNITSFTTGIFPSRSSSITDTILQENSKAVQILITSPQPVTSLLIYSGNSMSSHILDKLYKEEATRFFTFRSWFAYDRSNAKCYLMTHRLINEKQEVHLFSDTLRYFQELKDKNPNNISFLKQEYAVWAKKQIDLGFKEKITPLTFYHPYVLSFIDVLKDEGIESLFSRENQLQASGNFSFQSYFKPNNEYFDTKNYPIENIDFDIDGSYGIYNWELFFHTPLLIANRLSKEQRFEEAMDWYHYIFNPVGVQSATASGSPQKYWITKRFFEHQSTEYQQQRIDSVLTMLALTDPDSNNHTSAEKDLITAVSNWRNNPFDPHTVAQYRTVAYQKNVIMRYLDNLIAWADSLFRRDTMESVNEATQLYILAAELLGPRPHRVPPAAKPIYRSYDEMDFKGFNNALVNAENLIQPYSAGMQALLPNFQLLYFCLPQNDQLLKYWDTVADRLFKIRNCMNIEGVRRQLDLFAPPIDPGLLVRATAAGLDIGAILADLDTPASQYRFQYMLSKANELGNDLKSLGGALLSALEKKDGEALALLRQKQELEMLSLLTDLKNKAIEDAESTIDSLKKSKELIQIREQYYNSKEEINAGEGTALTLSTAAIIADTVAGVIQATSSGSSLIPDVTFGVSGLGSPVATVKFGGQNVGESLDAAAKVISIAANVLERSGSLIDRVSSYRRRKEDWDHQAALATKELEQIDIQILSAEIKLDMAQKELSNHFKQIEHSKSMDAFMRSKYTNQELYQWMLGQVSSLYFNTYKLAFDLAKKAQKGYALELGVPEPGIIQFGYWDSLKKGLMAGEKLQLDLRRLEMAYMDQNKRDFEITKHISLNQLNPWALLNLREYGKCDFAIPEELFDLDFPGHYFRRIKSVSITIPCVAGPYTTINATLRLQKNSVRVQTGGNYAENRDGDPRFRNNFIGLQSIATSSGQNDSGMFELNFRDERYLPFEGAGVISAWTLEMMHDEENPEKAKRLRQFDYNTISDVIVHLRYTAREDGGWKKTAIENLGKIKDQLGKEKLMRLFSLRSDFPNEWYRWVKGTESDLKIALEQHHFPYMAQLSKLKYEKATLFPESTTTPAPEIVNGALTVKGLAKDNRDCYVIVEYSISPLPETPGGGTPGTGPTGGGSPGGGLPVGGSTGDESTDNPVELTASLQLKATEVVKNTVGAGSRVKLAIPAAANTADSLLFVTPRFDQTVSPLTNKANFVTWLNNAWWVNTTDQVAALSLHVAVAAKNGASAFQHTANADNLYKPEAYTVREKYATELNHAALNDNPNAIIFATQVRGANGATETGKDRHTAVWYDPARKKWAIVFPSRYDMPDGTVFNILIGGGPNAFRHRVTPGSIHKSQSNVSLLSPAIAQNKVLMAMEYWPYPELVTNTKNVLAEVNQFPFNLEWYAEYGCWGIFTLVNAPIKQGMEFNILVL